MRKLDLVVIGTGAGAGVVAEKARAAGWSVAIADERPYGGTCALRGCDPKKVLVGAAEVIDAAERMRGKGVEGALQIAWPALMRHKSSFTEPVPRAREQQLAAAGIATLHGHARFVGPNSLAVGGEPLEARKIHIAAGARPMTLGILGERHLAKSDDFLALPRLPGSIAFIGSGFIAFELAHVAARAGARVTMIELAARPLAGFDPDLVGLLAERTRELGVELLLSTRALGIEPRGERLFVKTTGVDVEADLVVHAAGRVPDTDDLGLPAANVACDRGGIVVNEYMQSVSNPDVYAAGDAAHAGPLLTPIAAFEAHVAAANLLEGNHRKADFGPVPSAVFSLPPLAMVGLGEADARARGLKFKAKLRRTGDWYSARRMGERCAAHKILVEESSSRILGAHLIGPHADELINVFALAMRMNLTATDLKKAIFAYPTAASDIAYMV